MNAILLYNPRVRARASRPAAALLSAALALQGCAAPQVSVAPVPDGAEPRKVAVVEFDDRSEGPETVGETAADLFASELIKTGRYRVLVDRAADRAVKLKASESSGKYEVTATESRIDPFAAAGRLKADAVLIGAVTRYRERRAFIFPPALVALEVKLVDAKTREVLWTASHTAGYGAWRWLTFVAWPVGVALAFFSPPAQQKLKRAVATTAATVDRKLAETERSRR